MCVASVLVCMHALTCALQSREMPRGGGGGDGDEEDAGDGGEKKKGPDEADGSCVQLCLFLSCVC